MTNNNELFAALAKAQAIIKPVKANKDNPFFKSEYADLKALVEASRDALTQNGLSVIQMPIVEEGESYFKTILAHSSGQYIESKMKLTPQKPDVQSLGSYITYVRRYMYGSIIGIVITDEDDDGEQAMIRTIDDHQLRILEAVFKGHDELLKSCLKRANISSLKDLPSEKFEALRLYVIKEVNKKAEQCES